MVRQLLATPPESGWSATWRGLLARYGVEELQYQFKEALRACPSDPAADA